MLPTCHQIHAEASTILYSENVFVCHYTRLTPHPLALTRLTIHKYLGSMRRALSHGFFSDQALPVLNSTQCIFTHADLDNKELGERRNAIFWLDLKGSKVVAQRALAASCRFVVNTNETVEITGNGPLGILERDLDGLKQKDRSSSCCQLWKRALIQSEDLDYCQGFRRLVWTTDQNPAEHPNQD